MKDKPLKQQIDDGDIFFCHMPWTMIYSEVRGTWQTCCHAAEQRDMDVQNTSPEEWMKSDFQQKLRDHMLDPEQKDSEWIHHVCRRCKKEEHLYGDSRRLRKLRTWDGQYKKDILKAVELYKATGEYEFDFRVLETQVKIFGFDCNLDCHMCHPRHSTVRQKTQLKDGMLSEDVYGKFEDVKKYTDYVMQDRSMNMMEKLEELAPYTHTVKIIGGEPLLMKKQYDYLQMLIDTGHAKHIRVTLQTNMTKISFRDFQVIDFIPYFKKFVFTASLDSMGDAIAYCRRRSNWDEIVENIKTVKKFPNVVVDTNAVMGFLSILRFYEFVEWKEKSGLLDKHLSVYALENPPHLQVRNLPQKIKDNLIPKYSNMPALQEMLRQPPDEYGTEEALQQTFKYLLDGDEYYKGTEYELNLFDVFPELEEFYKPELYKPKPRVSKPRQGIIATSSD